MISSDSNFPPVEAVTEPHGPSSSPLGCLAVDACGSSPQHTVSASTVEDPHAKISPRRLTGDQLRHGQLALARFETAKQYRKDHPDADWKKVKADVGVTAVEYCRWNKIFKEVAAGYATDDRQQGATIDRADLVAALAKKSPPGQKPKFQFTPAEAVKVKSHTIQSNRTATAGSPQEATRHGVKIGDVTPETAAMLQQRQDEGKPLLTTAMRRQVEVGETSTRADRVPRESWLNYVQSPGSLQITVDEETGKERMYQPGEAWTIDDGTINFICCVPLEKPGDKCWDKFGVLVGRFQFILIVDHRSYFVPGFSYTARPRGSYRAEDLTSTIHIAVREHGMPRKMFLEHGVSASNLIHDTLKRAGIKAEHVASPHQKMVELIFNKLWTKLSFLPGQVGRGQHDDEQTNRLLQSCRDGHTDPRKHFLMLDAVVRALREVINDHNGQRIMHSRYGKWVPAEFWDAKAKANLRPLGTGSDWMFAPVITKPLQVRGFNIKTTVRLMDGLSQVFHFSAEWLQRYHLTNVKLRFNPFADAPAMVELANDFKGERAGTILGEAEMIDRQARFNLRRLGYGSLHDGQPGFPDIGLAAARHNAQALRRVASSIRVDGKPGITAVEVRSMQTANNTPGVNTIGVAAPAPRSDFANRVTGRGVEPEEFDRQAQRLTRDEERARKIEAQAAERQQLLES